MPHPSTLLSTRQPVWPWARSLPANLRPEQVRALHALSRRRGRTIRRIVTDAVLDVLAA